MIFTKTLFFRLDLTEENRYSLSRASKDFVANVCEPLTVLLYLDGDLDANMLRLRRATEDMVRELNMYSSEPLTLELVNPNNATTDEERYAVYDELEGRGLRGMSVTVRSRDGKMTEQVIFPWVEVCSSCDTMAVCLMQPSAQKTGEEAVNSAIADLEYLFVDAIRVLNRREVVKVAFIEGHGELSEEFTYDASDALSRYFQVDRGVLGVDASVLDDYAAIIIAKPLDKYSESDKFIIDQYIMRGGRVLWLLDGAQMSSDMLSEGGATPLVAMDVNLNDQLFRYGVRLTPTIVEDMQCAYMPINVSRPGEQPRFEPIPWFYTPLLQGSPYHPITKTLQAVKADFASGIEIVGDTVGVRKEVLLISSNASHVDVAPTEIDVMRAINVEPKEYFTTQYVPIAVALEGEFQSIYKHRMIPEGVMANGVINQSVPTRMVVVADGDIIRNDVEQHREGLMLVPLGYDRVTRQTHGNKDFVVNTM
ncbi:MAG: gliding motility-associated ABC transporter substrate-binding protein GldG, partial [Paludibacteraceae bacterium]|nr:gliding motility-associated ABC transporter substrate-binding protein GldG [Paludibacteraceae bacterium]